MHVGRAPPRPTPRRSRPVCDASACTPRDLPYTAVRGTLARFRAPCTNAPGRSPAATRYSRDDEGTRVNDRKDEEENRLAARAARYVKVGTNVGAVAARVASQRIFGLDGNDASNAAALAAALGGLKGPIMKVAQLLATIPEALPAEYAQELSQLQSQAPPMGPAFVRRRMVAELGPDWAARFKSFEPQPAASASLGQVHRATAPRRHGLGRQAAVSRHAVGRGGRPHPAQGGVRAARAHEPGGGDGRDPEGNLGAPARGARLRAGGAPHRALRRRSSPTAPTSACRASSPSCRPSGCSP